jgi:PilZ domain-containing protein
MSRSPKDSAESALAESIEIFFGKTGPQPTCWNERRRHRRFYYRCCAEALIYPLGGGQLPTPKQYFVLIRDLARGGLSLVHNQQLMPGQRLDIILNGEPPRALEVIWCRRLKDHRFVVGCRFMKLDLASDEQTAAG